jgi:hypothetical protein
MSPLLAAFVFTAGFFSTLFLLARWELSHQPKQREHRERG